VLGFKDRGKEVVRFAKQHFKCKSMHAELSCSLPSHQSIFSACISCLDWVESAFVHPEIHRHRLNSGIGMEATTNQMQLFHGV
jgi:hypothetical protein